MFKLSSRFLLVLLLVIPTIPLLNNKGFASAEEDAVEDDTMSEVEDEGEVEDEDDEGVVEEEYEGEESAPSATEEEEEETITASKDADTAVIFSSGVEPSLVAGKKNSAYIHFANRGSNNFIITSIDGSFRYPQEYSYVIQNFTVINPKKMVDSGFEGSFRYDFTPGELSGGRSFGLVINVNYKDAEDNMYRDAVFNQTIQVVENEEGLDAETFFMYLMLLAIAALAMLAIYHFTKGKRRRGKKRGLLSGSKPLETGTKNGPVDYSWIPEETLQILNQSNTPSPKRSPRKRATRRANRRDSD